MMCVFVCQCVVCVDVHVFVCVCVRERERGKGLFKGNVEERVYSFHLSRLF